MIITFDRHNTRKIVGWIIIIGVIIFIFANYSSDIKFNLSKNESSSKLNGCPNGVIPEYLEMIIYGDFGYQFINEHDDYTTMWPWGSWKDGAGLKISMEDSGESRCRKGELEGENINLIYCYNLAYANVTTPISKEGIIGKTESVRYNINLVLEDVGLIRIVYIYGVGNELRKYNILSASCKRV